MSGDYDPVSGTMEHERGEAGLPPRVPAAGNRQAIWSNMWVWALLGIGYLVGQATWGKPDFTVTALFIAGPFTAAMFYARVSEINSKLTRATWLLERAVVQLEARNPPPEGAPGARLGGLALSRSDRRWAEAMSRILRSSEEGNDALQDEE